MASSDAKPVPKKNVAHRVTFPIFDADGDLVTGAAGLDSEVSKDGAAFADCTNEATEIGATGIYTLDLTSTEMNADTVVVIVKTSTGGAKTTPIVMYPEEAGDIRVNVTQVNGTTQTAGDLAALINAVDDFVDTEVAAIKTQTDKLTFDGGNRVASNVTLIANDTITAASIAADAIGASEIAADAIGSSELAATAASEIAQAVWDFLTANAATANSFGVLVKTDLDATISSRLATAGYTAPPSAVSIRQEMDNNSADLDSIIAFVDSLETRLTATRAGLLDNLDAAISSRSSHTAAQVRQEMDNNSVDLDAIIGFVDALEARLTATRAGLLDNLGLLDYASSDLSAEIASLPTLIWAVLLADIVTNNSIGKLLKDNVDAAISSRSTLTAVQVRTEMDANSVDLDAIIAFVDSLEARLTAGRAANLDNLDALVSSRLATAGYTAPPSAAAVADAVWDEANADHLTAGTTGKNLSLAGAVGDPWAAALPGAYGIGTAGYILGNSVAIGNGVNPVTLHVKDGDGLAIPGALLYVKNDALTSLPLAWGLTDENGDLPVNLNDGNYKVIVVSSPRYETEAPVALVVAGLPGGPFNITLTEQAVDPPSAPDRCRVIAKVITADGTPQSGINFVFTLLATGTIEAGQPDAETATTFIGLQTFTVPTGGNGIMEKELVRSDFIQPHNNSSTQWRIQCTPLGIDVTRTLDLETLDLGVLLPLP